MVMQYTPVDVALCEAVIFRFQGGPAEPLVENTIQFQFPPKISNDSRKGTWDEEGQMPGTEPIATFATSGPREISLNWTYIIDGGKWDTSFVSRHVKAMRGYFARARNKENFRNLVVAFRMWSLGGEKPMSCRVKGVDVKHSETIVVPCRDGIPQPSEAYPLRTDITVDLRVWTQGSDHFITQDIKGLSNKETPDWY